jgi:hypothetical protein
MGVVIGLNLHLRAGQAGTDELFNFTGIHGQPSSEQSG